MWNRRGTVIITIQCLMYKQRYLLEETEQIRPGLNANEIKIPYDKHQDVSSLVKSHQTTHNPLKYEVI